MHIRIFKQNSNGAQSCAYLAGLKY
jgi:hypothetical protein